MTQLLTGPAATQLQSDGAASFGEVFPQSTIYVNAST
jgi:hypothetical protein